MYKRIRSNCCILVDETPAEIERPPTETYNKMEFQTDDHLGNETIQEQPILNPLIKSASDMYSIILI